MQKVLATFVCAVSRPCFQTYSNFKMKREWSIWARGGRAPRTGTTRYSGFPRCFGIWSCSECNMRSSMSALLLSYCCTGWQGCGQFINNLIHCSWFTCRPVSGIVCWWCSALCEWCWCLRLHSSGVECDAGKFCGRSWDGSSFPVSPVWAWRSYTRTTGSCGNCRQWWLSSSCRQLQSTVVKLCFFGKSVLCVIAAGWVTAPATTTARHCQLSSHHTSAASKFCRKACDLISIASPGISFCRRTIWIRRVWVIFNALGCKIYWFCTLRMVTWTPLPLCYYSLSQVLCNFHEESENIPRLIFFVQLNNIIQLFT